LGSLRTNLYRRIIGPISFQKLSIRVKPARLLTSSASDPKGSTTSPSTFPARPPQVNPGINIRVKPARLLTSCSASGPKGSTTSSPSSTFGERPPQVNPGIHAAPFVSV